MSIPTHVTALPRSSLQRSFASLILGVLLLSTSLHAQEGTWSISVAASGSLMSLKDVDTDGEKDVAGYLRDFNIPIAKYTPLRFGYGFEGRLGYRFERDMEIRFFGGYTRVTAETAFRDSTRYLSLNRLISSTDFGIDISYYFPPLVYDLELDAFVGLGRMQGFAEQTTSRTHQQKTTTDSGLTVITFVDDDAYSHYRKARLYVRAGMQISWRMSGPFTVLVDVLYKYAPLGHLDGIFREFTLERPHTTTIPFDFSTLDVKVGLAMEL